MSTHSSNPLCPICGYDRSGDGANRCPECGTHRPPESNIPKPVTDLLGLLTVSAAAWLTAYLVLVARTYREGVFQDREDSLWRVGIGLVAAAFVVASGLLWRRRASLAQVRLSVAARQLIILALCIATALGGILTLAYIASDLGR